MIIKSSKDKLNSGWVGRLAYPLGLLTLVLLVLLYIEYKHPYFFLQDDNRDYMLPYFVHNYESLLIGEIALYNFHQFLGTPSLALGNPAVLYPLPYLSVLLSKMFFGHYFAAIDIQVFFHLMIGAVGLYFFIRFFDIDHRVALFGGLTWSLSSFIIYVANSWVVVTAPAAYFPWMLLFSFRLYKKPSTKVTFYAVLVRLLFFYVGYIQYFIYSVIFEFITVILFIVSDSLSGDRKVKIVMYLKKYIVSYIYVLIFSLPLLLSMWYQTTISVQRSSRLPFEVFVNQFYPVQQLIKGFFYPFSVIREETPWSYRNMVSLSHIGYLTMICLIAGIIKKLFIDKSKKFKLDSIHLSVFVRPALLAFLWSTNWVFNLLIYVIPILNRFRWPFKLALYLDFYLIIIAMLILAYFIKRLSWKETPKNILFCLIIGIQIFNFAFLYTVAPYKDFGEHHGDKLPLTEKLQDKLIGGRIISLGFDIWASTPKNDYPYLTAPTLGFNYATLWGLDYFAGYEPLLSSANSEACLGMNFTAIISSSERIPVDYLRKAAVKWYIVPESKADEYTIKLSEYGIVKRYGDENRVVFYDAKAYPMVFNSMGEQIESEDYRITTNSIELSVNCQQSDVIIFNNLYNSFFEGFIDGKKTTLTPINKIHFSISVPEGKHHILIRYKDPYLLAGTCLAIAFSILLVSALTIRIVLKRQ
jgi:hypothetical protein